MADRTPARLPEHSIYTALCGPIDNQGLPQASSNPFEARFRAKGLQRLAEIAEWACRHIRGASSVEFDILMVRFAMAPIDPKTPIEEILLEARKIAKHFALEECSQAA